MELTVAEKIRIVMKRQGMTLTELAQATGQTRQNLSNKMSRDNFTLREVNVLAQAIGVELICAFRLPDGTEI